jgi:hypothetical protein
MMYPIGTYAYQSIADHGEMACFAALAESLFHTSMERPIGPAPVGLVSSATRRIGYDRGVTPHR